MINLHVSEIFGPTIQGEGPSAGRLAIFLRLAGCNLSCSWCDSKYSWDKTHEDFRSDKMTVEQIAEKLWDLCPKNTNPILVITGGEPMLQGEELNDLIPLIYFFPRIEVETNGTITPNWLSHFPTLFFNISPKLSNSNVPFDKRINTKFLRHFVFTDRAIFKFVVQNSNDILEIEEIVNEAKIPNSLVWLIPLGISEQEISENMKNLAEIAIERGWNISPRLHIQLWGNMKGK